MATVFSDKKLNKISRIDEAVKEYFINNPSVAEVPAKDLMPLFINKGIFLKDHQKGYYIRDLLRQMDAAKKLHLLSNVKVVRKDVNSNWYFVRNI